MGTEIPGGGGRGRLSLTPCCHHQNDSAIRWAAVYRGQNRNSFLTFVCVFFLKSFHLGDRLTKTQDCVHKLNF